MQMLVFDNRFPLNFDLADPWPANPKWWSERGRYIGPSMDDCLVPATMATKEFMTQEGKTAHSIRKQFAGEWAWVHDPAVFIHKRQNDRMLSTDAFNRCVRPFSHVNDTARLLLRFESSHADGVQYAPDEGPGIINKGGRRLMNTYRPPTMKPIEGDVTPFLEFMAHLIPVEQDKLELMRWCATLIARPDIRMLYGVLLISEVQGVGKGTLGEKILAPLLGAGNVSFPSEQEVCDSSFNSWLVSKRLAVVHEIYAGQSKKAYNKLKSTITDREVTASLKYISNYTIANWIHIFACSNSLEALKLDIHDRRWLVPGVTNQKKTPDYWRQFHTWLDDDGLGIIKWWAADFLTRNEPVLSGTHAPMTEMKREVIEAGRSEGQRLAHDIATNAMEQMKASPQKKVVFIMSEVRQLVANTRHLDVNDYRMEKLLTLRKTMLAVGMHEPMRTTTSERTRMKIETRWQYVVANFPIAPDATWDEIKEYRKDPAGSF